MTPEEEDYDRHRTHVLDLYGREQHTWENGLPCLTRMCCGERRLLDRQSRSCNRRHIDDAGVVALAGAGRELIQLRWMIGDTISVNVLMALWC